MDKSLKTPGGAAAKVTAAVLVPVMVLMLLMILGCHAQEAFAGDSVRKAVSIEFKPADSFIMHGLIGLNEIEESHFYGEGNCFDVTYETQEDGETTATEMQGDGETTATETQGDGETTPYTVEYVYVKTEDESGEAVEGFFEAGDVKKEQLELGLGDNDFDLREGDHDLEVTYIDYVDWQDDPIRLPLRFTLRADKYDLYCSWKVYDYTGKAVTPKFVVRRMTDDKVVPASEYTYTAPKKKAMGYYDVDIMFKDEFKDRYLHPVITATYGIGPARPVIKTLKGGRKTITVNWKKFTAKQLKTIDGMHILAATDKHFYKNLKTYTIKGKALKNTKKVLKGLKAKKKYYVVMFTYKKKVKQAGYTFSMQSDDSKIKSAKTK